MATGKIKIMDLWRLLNQKPKRVVIERPKPAAAPPLPKRVQLKQPVRVMVKRSMELGTGMQLRVVGSVGSGRLLLSVGRDVVEVSRAAVTAVAEVGE